MMPRSASITTWARWTRLSKGKVASPKVGALASKSFSSVQDVVPESAAPGLATAARLSLDALKDILEAVDTLRASFQGIPPRVGGLSRLDVFRVSAMLNDVGPVVGAGAAIHMVHPDGLVVSPDATTGPGTRASGGPASRRGGTAG